MREIIVKIPDTAYEGILNADKVNGNWGKDLLGILCNAIANGTPLPKGHGTETEWIPVSERLPKKGGCYICTCYNGAIKTVAFFKWQNRLKQWEKTGTRAYWKIIAWMPLPPSYQGEK